MLAEAVDAFERVRHESLGDVVDLFPVHLVRHIMPRLAIGELLKQLAA